MATEILTWLLDHVVEIAVVSTMLGVYLLVDVIRGG